MNTRGLLDQLLSSGKELLQGQHTAQSNQTGQQRQASPIQHSMVCLAVLVVEPWVAVLSAC